MDRGRRGLVPALALGLIAPAEAIDVIDAVAAGKGALLFLLALLVLLVLTALVEKSGFFEWAAIHAARLARGDARALYRNVFVLGALITAALSLDTTAAILTPLVLALRAAPPAAGAAVRVRVRLRRQQRVAVSPGQQPDQPALRGDVSLLVRALRRAQATRCTACDHDDAQTNGTLVAGNRIRVETGSLSGLRPGNRCTLPDPGYTRWPCCLS